MGEDSGLLSQSEIDALLAAVSADGDSDSGSELEQAPEVIAPPPPLGKSIRLYDFRRPERFSKEQIRALRMIHETWARRVSVSLSTRLRMSVEMTLADIDQDAYTSLVNHIPGQGVYYIISPLPLPGHFMLHMGLDLVMVIVDRMLGGSGSAPTVQRTMTDLEMTLLKSMSDKILADLQEAWATTASLRPRVDDVSLNLLLIPIALPSDAVIWISFEVRVKDITSSIIVGLPYSVLKPIASRLSPYTWLADTDPDTGGEKALYRQKVEHALTGVPLPISVLLGSTQLSVRELTLLRRDDVLPLRTETDTLCPILINGHPKFLGQPGIQRRKLAIRIQQVIEDDTEPIQLNKASIE